MSNSRSGDLLVPMAMTGAWCGTPKQCADTASAEEGYDALKKFDDIYYSGERPGYLQGYKALKEIIKPWGT